METRKKPKYVSIATQKGGAGKSSLTILSASILHYMFEKNVAIIDCDAQGSIAAMRDRDLKTLAKNQKIKKLFLAQQASTEKSFYPIKRVEKLKVENSKGITAYLALEAADGLSKEHDLDYVFFDIPGTVQIPGVISTLSMMDYIFCPFSPVSSDIESSADFCAIVANGIIQRSVGNLKEVYGFWNSVDGRVKTPVFNDYSSILADMGIKMLETRIPRIERGFGKELSNNPTEIFKSTILAPRSNVLYDSKVLDLVNEMVSVMEPTAN